MLGQFKAFIMKGNVVDMAVGVIIGAAFGKIVTSFINDVLMPPLGLILGQVDFKDLYVSLDGRSFATMDEAVKAGAPLIKYGLFINTVLDFLVVAAVIYFVINKLSRMVVPPDAVPPTPPLKVCPECVSEVPLAAKKCRYCGSQI